MESIESRLKRMDEKMEKSSQVNPTDEEVHIINDGHPAAATAARQQSAADAHEEARTAA